MFDSSLMSGFLVSYVRQKAAEELCAYRTRLTGNIAGIRRQAVPICLTYDSKHSAILNQNAKIGEILEARL